MSSAELFRKASGDELLLAEQVRRIFAHTPKAHIGMADCLVASYWSRVGQLLQPHDRIEVSARDGSWFAELLVRACGPEGVVVMVLRGGGLPDNFAPPGLRKPDPAEVGEVDYEYAGPILKYQVIRKADRHVMKSGFPTQDAAAAWFRQYAEMVARTSKEAS
jgi:hypothetical protein